MINLTRKMVIKIWRLASHEAKNNYLRFYGCADLEELLDTLIPEKR